MSVIEQPTARVLIVEDDENVAFLIRETLSDAGMEIVAVAPDQESALSAARAGDPNVALVDIGLADGETGIQVADALSGLAIECIFVTARTDGFADTSALGALYKPVRPHDLIAAVEYAAALHHGGLAPDPPTNLRLFRAGHPAR